MKQNSKFEIRNSKQIRIPNTEYSPEEAIIRISNFEFVSGFEFRISNFMS
jgi:hypothetical protein